MSIQLADISFNAIIPGEGGFIFIKSSSPKIEIDENASLKKAANEQASWIYKNTNQAFVVTILIYCQVGPVVQVTDGEKACKVLKKLTHAYN